LPPVALKPAKIKEKEKPADKAVEKPAKKAAVKKPVTDE
jgi:hypothetical protein